MTQTDDERFLHRGWEWLEGHADHDPRPENYDALEEEWLRRLRQYEETHIFAVEPPHTWEDRLKERAHRLAQLGEDTRHANETVIRSKPPVDARPNPEQIPRHNPRRGRTKGADDRQISF